MSKTFEKLFINSFPAGSSPGLDGMRPQYLKDIISLSAGEPGQQVLRALTKLFIVWPTSFRNLSFIIWWVFMPFIREMEELDQSL
jgi:hypothetical protein